MGLKETVRMIRNSKAINTNQEEYFRDFKEPNNENQQNKTTIEATTTLKRRVITNEASRNNVYDPNGFHEKIQEQNCDSTETVIFELPKDFDTRR